MADDADFANDRTVETLNRRIQAARGMLPKGGDSAEECEVCGAEIPEPRRRALPGVTKCVRCAERDERRMPAWARG